MAACRVNRPSPRARARVASARPSLTRAWSQRDRSWSARRTRSPPGSSRAAARASAKSSRASRPRASDSSGSCGDQQTGQEDGARGQVLPDQQVARGGVPGCVREVDDGQDRVEPLRQCLVLRDPERHPGAGDLLLAPGDPCGDRALPDEQDPGDLARREPAHQAQGECQLRVAAQGGVAAGEDQPERVRRPGVLAVRRRGLDRQQWKLAPQRRLAPEPVQRQPPGDGRQPARRAVRDAVGPGLQRSDEGVLCAVLREVEVARQAHRCRQDCCPVAAVRLLDASCDLAGVGHVSARTVLRRWSRWCRGPAGSRGCRSGREHRARGPGRGLAHR